MKNYLNNMDMDWFKRRLTIVMALTFAIFCLLVIRLFYLQVINGEKYRQLSANNCIRLQTIDAPRGLIFDRHGELLVDNRPSFNISIIPKDAKPIDATLGRLAAYAQIPKSELEEKLKKKKPFPVYKPVLLKADIGRDMLAAIEVNWFDLPGVVVGVNPIRHYINAQTAAHLIGYMGEINSKELKSGAFPKKEQGDFIGKFGVERSFEDILSGREGGRQVEVNSSGRIVQVLKTVAAEPGQNIYLTIDKRLQQKAESLLAEKAGAIVAMDPNNGQVLALASSPSFDQNAFVGGLSRKKWQALISDPRHPMTYKAIQGEYPPGSIYKIVTAMAGLEEHVIDRNTVFFCPGHYRLGNRVFRCWKKSGHGKVNLEKAITQSCDVYFYQVGQKLGVDRLAWYAKACGLGALTGIHLAHENAGLIPTAAWKKRKTGVKWQGGETLSMAIGQGYNLVTPLQMAVLISAIANGGYRYRPVILYKSVTAKGEVVKHFEKQVVGKLPVSKANLALIRRGLWDVVNGNRGTARIARLKDIEISGKTGTAQVFSRKAQESMKEKDMAYHLKSHAWFVAYAPSNKPEIAVAVLVEHGAHGSRSAAPLARDIIQMYLGKKEPSDTGQMVSLRQ
ncbi:MAG: penicillin-binding protein 2 [Deltaproteobacteria bacterium]|nr:MAG: penicillin-binding protein 2 [Deltaproteobacteria bacterium]